MDAAHNVASIQALLETLDESFTVARRLLIFATSQDKDIRGMLQCLDGRFDDVYFTRYENNSRAVPPDDLRRMAEEVDRPALENVRSAGGGLGCGEALGDRR